ncbi:zinc ribbon domain-containing protein [Shewanella sp. GXUN23E]|uniref:zinc ribbon domain-containing protein n=1 Tax=Shewanella sp. GXUN23E TaxID=3422498 RepID=UPI003D7D67DD
MSIICCPECNKEISDKAPSCIHCGLPISQSASATNQVSTESKDIDKEGNSTNSVEKVVTQGVDLIFGLLYLYLGYSIFFTDELKFDNELESAGIVFGLIIAFAVLYFVQKLTKSILGTIARMFDNLAR